LRRASLTAHEYLRYLPDLCRLSAGFDRQPPAMSRRSSYGSDEEDLDIHVRRYQRAASPQYVQTVRDTRPPRGYYQSGPVYLAPERSSGTMITTRTSRSRSRERRSSPPHQQMAPVVIENKIINEHSSDSDSDRHHRHRHRDRDRAPSSTYRDELALERVRLGYDELRLRDEEREREARRAMRDARDNSELVRAKAKLDEIERERERHEAEERVKKDLELKHVQEEQRKEEEKRRRDREAEEAVEKYKLKLAREKEEKEKAEKEYKLRVTADLLAAGVPEKDIGAILEKKKIKQEEKEEKEKDRPTYTRMSLRHLDIETLVYYKIEFEYDQVSSQELSLVTPPLLFTPSC
jgi:hypothetical protein